MPIIDVNWDSPKNLILRAEKERKKRKQRKQILFDKECKEYERIERIETNKRLNRMASIGVQISIF